MSNSSYIYNSICYYEDVVWNAHVSFDGLAMLDWKEEELVKIIKIKAICKWLKQD